MALIQVSQISFESEVCGINGGKIVNKYDIIADVELMFGQFITHDKMNLV